MGRRSRRRITTPSPPSTVPVRELVDLARRVQEADAKALALHQQLDVELLARRRSGVSVTALAASTGFSRTTVHKALNRAAERSS